MSVTQVGFDPIPKVGLSPVIVRYALLNVVVTLIVVGVVLLVDQHLHPHAG